MAGFGKFVLASRRYLIVDVQELVRAIEPRAGFVLAAEDDEWWEGPLEAWLTLRTPSALTFYSVLGFDARPNILPWPMSEDADLFEVPDYRLDGRARWEVHVWDSSEALLIASPGFACDLPDGWRLERRIVVT